MARLYAEHYGLLPFAGSDNHSGSRMRNLAGMYSSRKIVDGQDFVRAILNGEMTIFHDMY